MAIKPPEISSDLTLEMDEAEISMADFSSACDAFTGLIREVSRETNGDAAASSWTVRVYDGSIGIGVSARIQMFSLDEVALIVFRVTDGISKLARGLRPEHFSDTAIENARRLAATFKGRPVGPALRIWTGNREAVNVPRTVAATAKELLDAAYEAPGSVEGILKKLDGHGKQLFVIYDIITDRAIKCEVKDDLMVDALDCWQKRVEVYGNVRFRPDGQAVSVAATKLVPFPTDEEIPSLEEMRKIFSGA